MLDSLTPEAIKAFGDLGIPAALILLGVVCVVILGWYSVAQVKRQGKRDDAQERRDKAQERREEKQSDSEDRLIAAMVSQVRLQERTTGKTDELSDSIRIMTDSVTALTDSIGGLSEDVGHVDENVQASILEHDTKMDERVEVINSHATDVAGEVALAAQATILEALAQTEERMKSSIKTASVDVLTLVEEKLAELTGLVDEQRSQLTEVRP